MLELKKLVPALVLRYEVRILLQTHPAGVNLTGSSLISSTLNDIKSKTVGSSASTVLMLRQRGERKKKPK